MAKKFFGVFFIFLTISLFIPQKSFAHPGSTSSDGCHFCRTNCSSWGYTANTRHGHSGQACDPSKGPIDPLYGGSSVQEPEILEPINTPTPRPRPTATPTTKPTSTPTPTSSPTPTPTLEPTATPTSEATPTPTEEVEATPTPTPIPEVKGETTETKKNSQFRWWMLTPATSFLAFIFGWK